MRFYTRQHQFYCGIDLHSKAMHVCVVDQSGKKLLHRNFKNDDPQFWLQRLEPFRHQDLVVGCKAADVVNLIEQAVASSDPSERKRTDNFHPRDTTLLFDKRSHIDVRRISRLKVFGVAQWPLRIYGRSYIAPTIGITLDSRRKGYHARRFIEGRRAIVITTATLHAIQNNSASGYGSHVRPLPTKVMAILAPASILRTSA